METAVSVFGLGYVGCVSAACLAGEGHTVTGVDINASKVDMINAGETPVQEAGLAELVKETVEAGRLRATVNVAEAVAASSVSLICVGTPSRANGSIDLRYVERVCEQIGEALREDPDHHTVVVRSTVLPGTIEELVIPTLERASGRTRGEGMEVAMNPEFLREGSSLEDFHSPPFTLIGAADDAAAEPVAALYRNIDAPLRRTSFRTAEMVKYACNCFHGLKVGFANEIGNISKAVGADGREVMDIFCEDTKLNISAAYLKPGFAFGGSCLPKDLRAITYRGRQEDIPTPILHATLESNQEQIDRAINMVLAAGNRKVGVLGMSFKQGTDDLRESPTVAMIEALIGKGMDLAIYDRDVSRARLLGTNREFIEREIPHIWSLVKSDLSDVIDQSETLVVSKKSEEFRASTTGLGNGKVLIDLAGLFEKQSEVDGGYQGIAW